VAVKILTPPPVEDSDEPGNPGGRGEDRTQGLAGTDRATAALDLEAEAGRAVRHENLAVVLARGEDERGTWMMQEFVPGRSLEEVLAEDGPLPEPLLRSTLRQLASALSALHGAGWRHGDVKPANVRLDADGRAVLIDLGFARPFDREPATAKARAGTPAYLSPEQIRGRVPTAASDMFSLGISAFRLATGHHPFGKSAQAYPGGSSSSEASIAATPAIDAGFPADADEFLDLIQRADYLPPSSLVPQLSPFLDLLLEELLAREPARRPDAAELVRRLTEQEPGAWWRQRVSFSAASRRGSRGEGVAAEFAPLVGRESEMERLEQCWHARGDSPFLWIEGSPGMGTSRLAHAFAARMRLQAPPPLFLYGRCRRLEEDRPCQPILRLLQRWLRLPRATVPGPRETALLADLVPPSTAAALAISLDPAPSEAPPVAIPEALALWLAALASSGPLLIFLDDIERADEGTISVLQRLAEAGADDLLCLLGSRTDAVPRRPGPLADLRRSTGGDAARLPLGPLKEEDIRALVDALFPPSEPRAPLASALWKRTLGNPSVAVEILRDLIERGDVLRSPEGLHLRTAPEDLPLPRSLEEAILDRLSTLEPVERLWLQRLAVAAPHLEAKFLARAFHAGSQVSLAQELEIERVLAQLGTLGWLVPAGASYRFALPAGREIVYGQTRPDRRRRLHRAVAAVLTPEPGQGTSLGDTFRRTWHLRQANDHAALLESVRDLLPRVLDRGQYARVHRLCLWGLQALEEGPQATDQDHLRLELLEAAADAADRLGHRERQREVLDRIAEMEVDSVRSPDLAGRMYMLHGRHAVGSGRYGLARGLYRNAAELFEGAGVPGRASEALRRLAHVQGHVGETEEARTLARRARELATTGPQEAAALLAEGVVDILEDHVEAALAKASQAASLLRTALSPGSPGRLRHMGAYAAVHLLRARAWRQAGRRLRALAAARRAVRAARAAGEVRLEVESLARQGALLLDIDQVEAAEDRLREALALAGRLEDRRSQALAGVFLGILLGEADRPEARAQVERARAMAEDLGLNRLQAVALAIRARLDRRAGQEQAAAEASGAATDLLQRFGCELSDRIVVEGTRALILNEEGQGERARDLIRALRKRMRLVNRRFVDPVHRRRHRIWTTRLLQAALSPEGPVYPRARLQGTSDIA
jgi:tetratricopeptide (TPR) repeat protein